MNPPANNVVALQPVQAMSVSSALGVNDIVDQVKLIQNVMSAVMRDGEHYGKIPGCGDKPSLLQPGAQKLLLTFRLAPFYEIFEASLPNNHREYRVQCTLRTITGECVVGQGVGLCSTVEGKYRFRPAPRKPTDRPVPSAYWETRKTDPKKAQEILGGPGFSTVKTESGWMIAEGSGDKVEHDNPADYFNTVLKMAKKRALVDAVLTATAASDIFTQDIEDIIEDNPSAPAAAAKPQPAPEPPAPTPAAAPAPVEARAPGPLAWRDVIVTIPRAGMKRDEYLKNPDTIGSLYDARADRHCLNRLFGLAHEWKPEPREWKGKVYQPSPADHNLRAGLDQFLDWHATQPKEHESRPIEEDDVPF